MTDAQRKIVLLLRGRGTTFGSGDFAKTYPGISQAVIARDMGESQQSISKKLKALEATPYIQKEHCNGVDLYSTSMKKDEDVFKLYEKDELIVLAPEYMEHLIALQPSESIAPAELQPSHNQVTTNSTTMQNDDGRSNDTTLQPNNKGDSENISVQPCLDIVTTENIPRVQFRFRL